MKASVIDLGYNSLKMVSYSVQPDGSFRAFEQHGELTRLGEGLHETGFLGSEPIERTIRELEFFNEINKLQGIDRVLAIATSPVRDAGNGSNFIKEVESRTELKMRVLSGKEEALFSYIGAARATRLPNVVFFDLGGGSLELVCVHEFKIKRIMSLPLGALRTTELYRSAGKRSQKKEYLNMERRVLDILPTRGELGLDIGDKAIALLGVGGTIRALARYDQLGIDYPLNKLHNYKLQRKSITAIHKKLRKMSSQEMAKIEVFGKERAGSMSAGTLVVGAIMSRLGFDELIVSTHGLREGILSEYLRDPAGYHRGELTEQRANASVSTWREKHSKTGDLIGSLESQGFLDPRDRTIIDEALNNFLEIYRWTRGDNLFYTVLSEDSTLAHRDQVALAIALVRAKTTRTANWFYARFKSLLLDRRKESINIQSALIQLGAILEMTGAKAQARYRDGSLTFEVVASRPRFPTMLLGNVMQDLEEATERRVKTMARVRQRGGKV